jgi:hypothetical protein
MATWKKIAISGSNVSQFANDAGFLTSGTLSVPKGFSTGSFGGTDILANATTGSFNIVSGSGAGLKISTDAGTRTATFTLSAIPNTSLANDSVSFGGVSVDLGASDSTPAFNLSDATGYPFSSLASVPSGLVSGSAQINGTSIQNNTISGVALGSNLNDLTVDNVSLQLNSGTTYNGSAARTISIKDGGIDSAAISSSLGIAGTNQFTGSFSGSYTGIFTGTTNLPDLTDGNGIADFTYDGSSTAQVAVQADGDTIAVGSGGIKVADGEITTVQISSSIAGNGLTGGDGSALAVGAGTGIDVAADEISVDVSDFLTNGVNNRVVTATGADAMNAEANLTFDGTTLTVTGNEILTGNLIVQGTASFQHNEELAIKDRFILMASGSTSAGDGGIVIQQAADAVGELFAFDSGTVRWGLKSAFDASDTAYTPEAFISAVVEGSTNDPDDAPARYDKKGNIFVANNEDIYIYS